MVRHCKGFDSESYISLVTALDDFTESHYVEAISSHSTMSQTGREHHYALVIWNDQK